MKMLITASIFHTIEKPFRDVTRERKERKSKIIDCHTLSLCRLSDSLGSIYSASPSQQHAFWPRKMFPLVLFSLLFSPFYFSFIT